MNREIKFRALKDDMSNCKFLYGSLVFDAIGEPRIARVDSSGKGLEFNHCIRGTVGQFTGLKDKNGTEIYEGDIIQDSIVGMKSQVVFTEYANFGIKSLQGLIGLEYDVIDPSWTESSVFVIGNIHENPELLKLTGR